MPATPLSYNGNDLEHSNVAQTLGFLQGAVDKGTINKDPNSKYTGFELREVGETLATGYEYRKKDVPGTGRGMRTQNRVIVVVDTSTGAVVEGIAYFWRHDSRIYKLDKTFFPRAATFRNF